MRLGIDVSIATDLLPSAVNTVMTFRLVDGSPKKVLGGGQQHVPFLPVQRRASC